MWARDSRREKHWGLHGSSEATSLFEAPVTACFTVRPTETLQCSVPVLLPSVYATFCCCIWNSALLQEGVGQTWRSWTEHCGTIQRAEVKKIDVMVFVWRLFIWKLHIWACWEGLWKRIKYSRWDSRQYYFSQGGRSGWLLTVELDVCSIAQDDKCSSQHKQCHSAKRIHCLVRDNGVLCPHVPAWQICVLRQPWRWKAHCKFCYSTFVIHFEKECKLFWTGTTLSFCPTPEEACIISFKRKSSLFGTVGIEVGVGKVTWYVVAGPTILSQMRVTPVTWFKWKDVLVWWESSLYPLVVVA